MDSSQLYGKQQWSSFQLEKSMRRIKSKRKRLRSDSSQSVAAVSKLRKLKKKLRGLKSLQASLVRCESDMPKELRPNPGSSSDDPQDGGEEPKSQCRSETFQDIKPILEKNCMSCHSQKVSSRGVWQLDEVWFEANALFARGKPEFSEIYRRLIGNPESYEPADMPLGDQSLSQDEIAKIRCWISGEGGSGGDEDPSDDGSGDDNGGGGGSVPPSSPVPQYSFVCDGNRDPSPRPLMRLSTVQYRNTIRDLL
ncbi:MAG: hypothetical protein KDD60_11540, partial [Bdellovibrionales bacterium]|nr:hypothetical protein [Bdellovibrionales bacterium]